MITDDHGIDLVEMNKFIEIGLITEHRNKNFTKFEEMFNDIVAGTMFDIK